MGNQNSSKVNLNHPPVNWTQSFPRENRRLKKYGATTETKVLPQRIPGQRLRPTENGHILQTKGTITGRRVNEFHTPHHPSFPPPMSLHHPHHHPMQQHQHSASMTALHFPSHQDERSSSIHDLRFGRPPSKNYASEPDLRGSCPPPAAPMPMPHTIISQSPTKGRIKSKKKYKAPPVPQGDVNNSQSLPRGAMRSHSLSDMGGQGHSSHGHNQCAVHFADHDMEMTSSPEVHKQKKRKIGLFRKKNESRRFSSGEDQRSSGEEQERGRTEIRRAGAVSPVPPTRYSPRDELRERARSLDCLHHELRHSLVPPVPTAATSMTHLHHTHETRLWSTLERDSRRSARHEVESRRSSTLERESRRSVNEKRIIALEKEVQKSHRRMSTLERKVEERKHLVSEGHDNPTPSSSSRVSRLDSYRDKSNQHRSSSSGSHHEEKLKKENTRIIVESEKIKVIRKSPLSNVDDEWAQAEAHVNNSRKLSANLQAELINRVNNLRKSSTEQEKKSSTLTRKGKESDKKPGKPASNHNEENCHGESQPKTFFFGMEPEVPQDPRGETNTGLHKIKNQPESSKSNKHEEVHIIGQTVEFSRRTIERSERSQSRNRSTRKETQKATQTPNDSAKHVSQRKLSKDVEEFAIAIERHKINRHDGDSGASGSSKREDGGYHSRQNSGSLYLENESDSREEGQLCMNLRPMLPRRQFEIPRFSPNAAWRSLSLERSGRHTETQEESQSSEGHDSVFESRIQRFTRPTAPPRGSGEKSADSGISGDAGSPGPTHEFETLMQTEKTKSSSGPLAVSSPVVSGRTEGLRRTWTPAQDLDDNSLESNGEPADIPTGLSTPPKLTSRSNMFSKSKEVVPDQETEPESPVEAESISELISREDKDRWSKRKKLNGTTAPPQTFNSLRKLKRSMSGSVTTNGHKNYTSEDYNRSKTPDQPRGVHPEDSHWRDNWSMSRSIPNSLNTCEEQETISNLSSTRNNIRSRSESRLGLSGEVNSEDLRSRTPSYLMYGNGGHIMYLPEYNSRRMSHGEGGSEDELDRRHKSLQHQLTQNVSRYTAQHSSPENERKPPSGDEDPALPEAYSAAASMGAMGMVPPSRKLKGKKFSYQSTVRVLEMRKLEEKLTREVAEKEKQRLKEMEAMKKVEEEFQRKREREKKKVKHQLKMFHIQQQQNEQHKVHQQQSNMTRDTHNHSYSSEDHAPSSYSSEQHEVSSQTSSQPPPLPHSPPPQVYPSFTSLPQELPTDTCSGLISGIKSWVKGRKESRSSTSSNGLTSAPRQEPDGAPASSPRKISDDYRSSGASSPKSSSTQSDQVKPNIRAEIIAASKKRSGNAVISKRDKQTSGKASPQHKSSHSHSKEATKQEPHSTTHDDSHHHNHKHHKHTSSKHHLKEDGRRSQSPDRRRTGSGLTQELSELHQERREYREYRTPSRHSRHSQSPPIGSPASPHAPVSPLRSKAMSNYRRDFCHGNAQVIGLNAVAVKGRRSDESDRYSKHSSEDRRSLSSNGVQRISSVDFLETGSCSSNGGSSSHQQPNGHPGDASLSQNYARGGGGAGGGGYPPVDSSPARFAHSILTPFNPVKGYRPVSFSPPPPTKILPVN